ncbi:hypothetical protein HUN41_00261 [Streptomyces phage Coruscant]|uniref:Uncharacterized protein n=1 Tax=Streptomyces phage Coruscant TaxID=2739834 RepID=A0A7G4AWF9_9CAUD|nr:hypothetical protein PP454_gp068 [Streptomyces phage Coruscant]QMP84349.1 hypothetical protein HUN41_00261 [Streptomyces phage Coruscant]
MKYNLFLFKDGNIIHEFRNVTSHNVHEQTLHVRFAGKSANFATLIPNHAYDYAMPEENDQ